jgi:uncharacterized protein (DUF1015 family)
VAEIRPFRGLRYRLEAVGDISLVLAPPYDVVTEPERQRYLSLSPYNIVRLDLGEQPVGAPAGTRDYPAAAALLHAWRQEGVLAYDERPCLYVYEQVYHAPPPRNELVRRRGFIAAVQLEPLGQGSIFPHEHTLSEPKRDRLLLQTHTRCSFSQIFALYEDPDKQVEEILRPKLGEAVWAYTDEQGVRHRLWAVDDQAALASVQEVMRDKRIVIADGHHRYETALAYQEQMRAQHGPRQAAPWDWVSMYLCNTAHRSLTILPAHRMIRRVPAELLENFEQRAAEYFDLLYVAVPPQGERRATAAQQLIDLMAARPQDRVFGAYWGRSYAVALRLRDRERALAHFGPDLQGVQRDLDVALLHAILIRGLLCPDQALATTGEGGNIYFERDATQAFRDVDEGRAAVAVFCNPTSVEDVMRVALAGERMPQKGTYFWPKVPAGLVLYDLRPGAPTLE